MSGEVSDYMIAAGATGAELAVAVKRLIEDGWEPLGGVCVYTVPVYAPPAIGTTTRHLAQALVKRGR